MKKQQNVVVFKLLILLFTVAFVAGSFANMLCIPRYVPDNATTHVAARRTYQSGCHGVNFIQLIDRTTIDDSAIAESVFAPKTIDLIPYWISLPVITTDLPSPQNQSPYSYRYTYLSCCTFRI